MQRRLNFTGRRKIRREDAPVRLQRGPAGLTFDADLRRIASYPIEPSARLYVEAYRSASTSWKRFDFGRVSIVQPPADRSLSEFEVSEGILFRVKVSAEGDALGKLLGEADAIRPRQPDEDEGHRTPLIDPMPFNLGSEIWRVSFEDPRPLLLINEKITGWSELVREPMFRALAAPAIMRQILIQILVIEGDIGDDEDPNDWRANWLRFCENLPSVSECPGPVDDDEGNREAVEIWIDDAVGAFSASSGLFEKFLQLRDKEIQT